MGSNVTHSEPVPAVGRSNNWALNCIIYNNVGDVSLPSVYNDALCRTASLGSLKNLESLFLPAGITYWRHVRRFIIAFCRWNASDEWKTCYIDCSIVCAQQHRCRTRHAPVKLLCNVLATVSLSECEYCLRRPVLHGFRISFAKKVVLQGFLSFAVFSLFLSFFLPSFPPLFPFLSFSLFLSLSLFLFCLLLS